MTRKEILDYWLDSSDLDFRAMESLFDNGHYVWALFVGHLVIEKLLKALYIKNIDINAPQIHDLLKIADKAKLELTYIQRTFLDEVTTFNLRTRYPDFKRQFYKKATQKFTKDYLEQVKEFRQWLIGKIKN